MFLFSRRREKPHFCPTVQWIQSSASGQERMSSNLYFICLFSASGSQSCCSTGQPKPSLLPGISCVFGGMVETKQSPDRWELWQEVGGRGRGAVLAEGWPWQGYLQCGEFVTAVHSAGRGKTRKGWNSRECSAVRREGEARRIHQSQAQLGLLLRLCCAAEDCPLSCPLTLNTPHGQGRPTGHQGSPSEPQNTQSCRSITSTIFQA